MFAAIRQKLKGWKTVIANALIGVPAALYTLWQEFSTVDFTPVIPAKYAAAAVVGMSVMGVVLRLVTTGPTGSKGDQPATPATKAGD